MKTVRARPMCRVIVTSVPVISFTLALARSSASGARRRVRDDGRGISAADAERVFEPFFTTKGDLGTGLGLPVVRDIVRSLSGTITMESVVGEGTTVTMVLPRFLGEGNSEL